MNGLKKYTDGKEMINRREANNAGRKAQSAQLTRIQREAKRLGNQGHRNNWRTANPLSASGIFYFSEHHSFFGIRHFW